MEQRITRLGQASSSEVNAAVKVTHDKVSLLIDMLVEQNMRGGMMAMFKQQAKTQAHAWLESAQGKAALVDIVDGALDAAEAMRRQATS